MRFQTTVIIASVLALAAAAPCKPVTATPPAPSTTVPQPVPVPSTKAPEPVPIPPKNPEPSKTPTTPGQGTQNPGTPPPKSSGAITAAILTKIAPATGSCAGANFPAECADAATAAPSINKSFDRWGIKSVGEQAAAVAIMLFESGNFKYNKNHFPGVPGQGTRNMQSPAFNQKYAAAIGVADPMADNDSSFGSAAWFISSQCSASVRSGLQAATLQGYVAYLTQCVGTTTTPEREAGWQATIAAMKG